MPVRGFDGRAVEDEEEQQQSKAALKVGASVLSCANHHSVTLSVMLESGGSRIVLTGTRKRQFTQPPDS